MASPEEICNALQVIDGRIVSLLAERIQLLNQNVKVHGSVQLSTLIAWESNLEKLIEDHVLDKQVRSQILKFMSEIWNESRHTLIQRPLNVACLGPPGTFTHIMALSVFGNETGYELPLDIEDVLELVACGRCDFGVVAIMNSVYGAVSENLEALQNSSHRIRACGERELLIEHTLMGTGDLGDVRTIYSHYQAIGQCRRNIERLRREAASKRLGATIETVKVASTGEAARLVSLDRTRQSAAIVHRLAGEGRGLVVLRDPFEDEHGNATRFLIITGRSEIPLPTGNDRTSFFLRLKSANLPGQLLKALRLLEHLNLTLILSYPKQTLGGDHIFFIELEGHQSDNVVQAALSDLTQHCEPAYPIVLGSYPKAPGKVGASHRDT